MLDRLGQDVRYGRRLIRRHPGFAAIAVLTLALGSGANTALFQLLDAVRLRALPVRDADELFEIRAGDMTHARGAWLRENALTNPLWERVRSETGLFTGALAWADDTLDITTAGEQRKVAAIWVSGDFFTVLGVRPEAGRLLGADEDRRGCGFGPGVVLSDRFWRQEFGGDRSTIGKAMPLGKTQVVVLGVTPASFSGLEVGRQFDVALPICAEPAWKGDARLDSGTVWWLTVMARRPPGVALEETAARLRARSPAIFEATLPPGYPTASVKPYLGMTLVALPASRGLSRLRAVYTEPLALLLGVTALILLIACVNVAHLLLARADARRREFAVRVALGAPRGRLAQQTLVETSMLSAAGTILGLLVAAVLCRVLIAMLAAGVPNTFLDVSIGGRTIAAAAILTVVMSLAAGFAPLRRIVSAPRLTASGALGWGRDYARGARLLLGLQVAFSLVLLGGTLLFVRTLRNLQAVDPGFTQEGVLIADVNFSDLRPSPDRATGFRRDLLQRLRALPGMAGAAEALYLPLAGGNWNNRMWMEGSDPARARVVMRNMIGDGYFSALNIPIVAGRDFSEHEVGAPAPGVAIVNEAFLRGFGLDRAAIGRRLSIEPTPQQPGASYEIVGIVGDTKYHDLREADPAIVYVPLWPAAVRRPAGQFVIRSHASLDGAAAATRGMLETMRQVRYSFRPYAAVTRDLLVRERLMAALATPFGVLGVGLTALGLYGVFSYLVTRRTREIGLRMALGAERGTVVAAILREALIIAGIGLAAGAFMLPFAAGAARSLLFGMTPYDSASLVAAVVALAAVAALASYIPARRAARVDPAVALRHDGQ
jgi:predicted permease